MILSAEESVKAFEALSQWEAVCGNLEEELKNTWEVSDEVYRDTKLKGAKSIACAVADPSADDCPLVYISQGFEELTGYQPAYALGKNCRFLQPKDRSRNIDINGDELERMKKFCTQQQTGHIVTLLYNVALDGSHFWNLLCMLHTKSRGVDQTTLKPYIFAVQTNLFLHKELVDKMVLEDWEGDGKNKLEQLRQELRSVEKSWSLKEISLKKLADHVVSKWILENGQSISSSWAGELYVPLVGRRAVMDFAGNWPLFVEEATHGLRALFEVTDGVLGNMKANCNDDAVKYCAVSDPTATDCPLVFVSKGFENMTGYDNEYVLGRNCRFLQPNTEGMNKKINGDELQRMRDFCKLSNPKGKNMVNILLNERRTGERFWNLLYMEHVSVKDRPYILAVQTVLDMPMPSILRTRHTSEAVLMWDKRMLNGFIDDLCVFLKQLRGQLRSKSITSMIQVASFTTESILRFMKKCCDDYEGDHLVPRLGLPSVRHFELDVTWKCIISKVKTLLVDIWDVSQYNDEEVACAVSDPMGEDCPLVYISQKFETMTGYSREWVLGRNCRFLQPNDFRKNMNFNEEDKTRMREFCSKPQPPGTRVINLLINESKTGFAFWNLLVMEHVSVDDHTYIFAVQTKIDVEVNRMTEILAMDRDGILELQRLRRLLKTKETTLQRSGMKLLVHDIIREWASDFPAHLELPRFKVTGRYADAFCVPMVGLALHRDESFAEQVQAGLEYGVRHFALTLSSSEGVEDREYTDLVGYLLSLRMAELLNNLRWNCMHYMASAMIFTLITRPQYVNSFRAMQKALTSCGCAVHCWFLDVRTINADRPSEATEERLRQCWQVMSSARKDGDVKAIGVLGPVSSAMYTMNVLKNFFKDSPVMVIALDDYPGKLQDQSRIANFRRAYVEEYGSPPLVTYSLYGPNNSLLKCKALQELASSMKLDAPSLLLKWAEAQGYAVLATSIKEEALKIEGECHRRFTRLYAESPGSGICAASIDNCLRDEGSGISESVTKLFLKSSMSGVTASPRQSRRNSTSVAMSMGPLARLYTVNGTDKFSKDTLFSSSGARNRSASGKPRRHSTGNAPDHGVPVAPPKLEDISRELEKKCEKILPRRITMPNLPTETDLTPHLKEQLSLDDLTQDLRKVGRAAMQARQEVKFASNDTTASTMATYSSIDSKGKDAPGRSSLDCRKPSSPSSLGSSSESESEESEKKEHLPKVPVPPRDNKPQYQRQRMDRRPSAEGPVETPETGTLRRPSAESIAETCAEEQKMPADAGRGA